ncbi:MAG: response regulator [Acidobacteriota bacterium]
MTSKPTTSAVAVPPSLPKLDQPARILIADDDPVILTLVEAALRGLDPEPFVRTATHGTQAIRLIDREPPDLVITDIRMPGADGLQLLAHVINERLDTTVIAMTGYATAKLRADVLRQGAYMLLEKPLDPDDLLQAVHRSLTESRPESSSASLELASILQLIEMESKSCEVSVASENHGSGFLIFQSGRLVHARTQEVAGDAAALDILALPSPYVDVRECLGTHPNTVTEDLERLLQEAALGDPQANPEIFDTRELSTGSDTRAVRLGKDPRLPEILQSVTDLSGFCGAALVDLERGQLVSSRAQDGGDELPLLAAPVCSLVHAEKALMPRADGEAANILVRQSRYWHLVRELKDDLALHVVLEGGANVAMAKYRLTRWLADAGLADEPPPASPPAGGRI